MASQGRERGRWPDSPGQGSAVPLTGAFASMSVSDPSRMQQGSISSGQVATHNDLSNQDDSSLGDQPDPLPLRSIPGSSQFTQHADSLRDAQPFSGRPEHGYMQNIPPAMHQFHQPASFEEHSQGQYGYPQMAYGRHIPYVYNMPFYARQPQSETLFADRYAAHTAHAPDGGLQLDGQRASNLTQIHSIPGTVETGMHGRRIARGPPRRPKQTGPAIWVGNLPPNADIIIELKDHFARDAVDDIESVYLNTLTRFAFVNYKNDSSCEAALQRCNDSFFHGMRLSCQPRSRALGLSEPKTSDAQSDVPQLSPPVLGTGVSEILEGPSAVAPRTATQSDGAKPPTSHDRSEPAMAHESITDNLPTSTSESRSEAARVSERFFIIKSLTIEDLDASARDGTWATQNHNERRLNEAFKSADNVYLIFPANKSGEFSGYAKMLSLIEDSGRRVTIDASHDQQGAYVDKNAPRGRVTVVDSVSGILYWQSADTNDTSHDASPVSTSSDEQSARIFRVEWHSTNRLPFYRTRGLRNPWNQNREVKIARDGTEVEPTIGLRLLQMFHLGHGFGDLGRGQGPKTANSSQTILDATPTQDAREPIIASSDGKDQARV